MLSSFGMAICYIPGLNAAVGVSPVIPSYYAYIFGTTLAYCVAVQIYKILHINVCHFWL